MIARLRAVALTLSNEGDIKTIELADMPTGWELPYTCDGGQRCCLKDIDYTRMRPLKSGKKAYYRCGLCSTYWKQPKGHHLLASKCPPCGWFRVAGGGGAVSIDEGEPELPYNPAKDPMEDRPSTFEVWHEVFDVIDSV